MTEGELIFVIPTYRLRDVCETVEKYDDTFWNNGHSPRIIVFDDSTVANHRKYYPLLEKTKTWCDVFYVGPSEKEQFVDLINKRLRDRNLQKAFYGFEADFFQQNLSRIVDDVINDIKGAMELWPTLVEICYFRKHRRELPQTKVRNHKRE